jgi:hypothetical protein
VTEDSKKVQKSHAHFITSGWLDALGVAQKVRFGKTKKKEADGKGGKSPGGKAGMLEVEIMEMIRNRKIMEMIRNRKSMNHKCQMLLITNDNHKSEIRIELIKLIPH